MLTLGTGDLGVNRGLFGVAPDLSNDAIPLVAIVRPVEPLRHNVRPESASYKVADTIGRPSLQRALSVSAKCTLWSRRSVCKLTVLPR